MNDLRDLPQAPASVTYNIQTKTGFSCLFSLRELDGTALLNKMELAEADFARRGIVPQPAKSFGSKREVEYLPNPCPKCNGKLIKGTGKLREHCENQRYDFTTRAEVGKCDYKVWNQ